MEGFKQLNILLSCTKWEKSGMTRRSELVNVWVTAPWLFILTTCSSPHGLLSALVSMPDCLWETLVQQSMSRHKATQKKDGSGNLTRVLHVPLGLPQPHWFYEIIWTGNTCCGSFPVTSSSHLVFPVISFVICSFSELLAQAVHLK